MGYSQQIISNLTMNTIQQSEPVLKQLIKPEYLPWFKDWIVTATPSEKNGFQVIKFIIDTRGLVKADQTMKMLEPDVREIYHSKFEQSIFTSYNKSEAFFIKKSNTSAYQREFGGLKGTRGGNSILRFMKIKEVCYLHQTEYAAWLVDLAAEFLERWRGLEDESDTQALVVDCLRSLNARYRFHQKPITEFQDKFGKKEIDWNLAIPKKINQTGTSTQ